MRSEPIGPFLPEDCGSVKPGVPLPRRLPIRETGQLGRILIHYREARIRNKNARPALRSGPRGAGNDISGRKTVSSKQQIMKTLSNNYCNENYWGGKGCRQAVCIWLMQLVAGVKLGRNGLFICFRPVSLPHMAGWANRGVSASGRRSHWASNWHCCSICNVCDLSLVRWEVFLQAFSWLVSRCKLDSILGLTDRIDRLARFTECVSTLAFADQNVVVRS